MRSRHQIRMMLLDLRASLAIMELAGKDPVHPFNKRYYWNVMAEEAREKIATLQAALSQAKT